MHPAGKLGASGAVSDGCVCTCGPSVSDKAAVAAFAAWHGMGQVGVGDLPRLDTFARVASAQPPTAVDAPSSATAAAGVAAPVATSSRVAAPVDAAMNEMPTEVVDQSMDFVPGSQSAA